MLFHVFDSQEARRNYGGSDFLEFQFCRLPVGTAIQKVLAVSSIVHWQNDSLYVNGENVFFDEYGHAFDCGIYSNLKIGSVDIYGINYYPPSVIGAIIEKINEKKPADHEMLVKWLTKSYEYNGFYILGI